MAIEDYLLKTCTDPKVCIALLREGYTKMKEHLFRKDYENAEEVWTSAILASQFEAHRENIKINFHCGLAFITAVNMLSNKLSKRDYSGLGAMSEFFEASLAQTSLPDSI